MKVKGIKLEWYVLSHDFNKKQITPYNIFYDSFIIDLNKEIKKKKITSRQELKDYISHWSKYNYWSRAEHEILVSGLFDNMEKAERIDVDWQIQMNLDLITDYVIKKCKIEF